ncbi:fibronectin type III domain-containing protein [Amphibiibacter pelophylacis]|uniref:Fibronectin type III domain-containing protein n=1 Tax=Amphibiibacter pelophylacis TaxID=1799477 RepID=A0ACC6P094_9BURK
MSKMRRLYPGGRLKPNLVWGVIGSLVLVLAACGGDAAAPASAVGPSGPVPVESDPIPAPPATDSISGVRVAAATTTLTLSWPAVPGAQQYYVYRLEGRAATAPAEETAGEALPLARTLVCGTTDIRCVDESGSSAEDGSSTRFEVEAQKSDGKVIARLGTVGDTASSQGAPQGLVLATGDSQLRLRWGAVRGASHYRVSGGRLAQDTRVKGISLIDQGLDPQGVYTYSIRSCNRRDLCSQPTSQTLTGQGEALTQPETPRLLLARAQATRLSLTWPAASGAQTYRLSRDGQPLAADLKGTDTAYTDTGLQTAVSYRYTLQACNPLGCSAPSAALDASTVPLYPVEVQVTGLDTRRSGAELQISATLGADTQVLALGADTVQLGVLPVSAPVTVRVRHQPTNGQVCSVRPAGPQPVAAGVNVILIRCSTPVALSYPQASVTLPLVRGVTHMAPQRPQVWVGSDLLSPQPLAGWTYSSSDPAVVTVDAQGGLSAVGLGRAQISAVLESDRFSSRGTAAVYGVSVLPATHLPPEERNAAQTVALERLDLTQVFAQNISSPGQLVIPGRELMVRAFLRALTPQAVAPPQMLLRARVPDGREQQVLMACPVQVPGAGQPADPHALYSLEAACTGVITDTELVQEGLQLTVASADGSLVQRGWPRVNHKGQINIHLVPIQIGTQRAELPDSDALARAVIRTLPVAKVQITRSKPLVVPASGSDSVLFRQTLLKLRSLSEAEGARRHWFGVMPQPATLAGGELLSSLSEIGGRTGASVGVADERTFLHALGHNLNLEHAPCGRVGQTDSAYTEAAWPGASRGLLSSTPIFDSLAGTLINPLQSQNTGSQTDIMGQCFGNWFSEYGFLRAAKHMEEDSGLRYTDATSPELIEAGEPVLYISGTISAQGEVHFNPLQLFASSRVSASSGSYTLRVVMRNGSVHEQHFSADAVSADPLVAQVFGVKTPRLTDIVRLEIVAAGRTLPLQPPSAGGVAAAGAQATSASP